MSIGLGRDAPLPRRPGCGPHRRFRPAGGPTRTASRAPTATRARCARRRVQVLSLGRTGPGEELLGHPHRTERKRRARARLAIVDLGQLHAAAADVEHDAVDERGRVDRGDVAEVSLVARPTGSRSRGRSPPARRRGTARRWRRRGSRLWRPRGHHPGRAGWHGRNARRRPASRDRARSPHRSAGPRRRARRRSGPSHTARRSASTSRPAHS